MLASAIIGLLAAIALPKFGNMVDKAKEGALKGQLGTLRSALSVYYADNEGIYPGVYKFPPYLYGMYHLHGKYVDLGPMVFKFPSYARFLNKSEINARDVYFPSGGPVLNYWMLFNYKADSSDPKTPNHLGEPVFSYWGWHPVTGEPASLANIATYASYTDTRGSSWSTW